MPVARFIRAPQAAPAVELSLLEAIKFALRIEDMNNTLMQARLDATLSRNITAAQALAERQAPGAPDAIKIEAITRAVAWFYEGPGLDEQPVTSIWRAAGCEALLSPWTVRRGGVIGE